MNEKIALIVLRDGSFEVRGSIDGGSSYQVSWSQNIGECLSMAVNSLGHPLVLPLSGPNTTN